MLIVRFSKTTQKYPNAHFSKLFFSPSFIIKPVKVYYPWSCSLSAHFHTFPFIFIEIRSKRLHPRETGQTSFNLHVSLCEGDTISAHYKTTVLLRAKKDMGSFSLEAPASKPAANQSHRYKNQRSRWEKWNHLWIEQGSKASLANSLWGSCYLFWGGVCLNNLKRSVNKYLWILMLAPL